ncbi:MAG: UDP-N-acetylglucosamine 2-epimerase (non-hydrolyzing) [Fimbriimonadaceae bacterium]|nr:UDP-N-acetylglucosamine 2-epimerase (non-hydrolyzing) [Chitinophagales bacterium]
MKILTVFGTRPEAIKMAMLIKKLSTEKTIQHKVCVTAQHREMLDQVLHFFSIEPDYDLNIMKQGQNLSSITGDVLQKITEIYKQYQPDLVIVHGDTTTCFTATLAAFYLQIKVAHIEAGMRTFNLQEPFPEEANRVLTAKLATYHFAPTEKNVQNLLVEGIAKKNIIKTGNTVIDALLYATKKVKSFSAKTRRTGIEDIFKKKKKIILVTGHRRENFGSGFIDICNALKTIAEKYHDVEIVYPVHLNPNVQKPVLELLSDIKNIHLIEPLEYPDFIFAMKNSWIILTDSGGIQEEAPSLGKPVLVMRNVTERPEAVKSGTVHLVGTNKNKIVRFVDTLYQDKNVYKKMSQSINPYGDGKASWRIVQWIKKNKKEILK